MEPQPFRALLERHGIPPTSILVVYSADCRFAEPAKDTGPSLTSSSHCSSICPAGTYHADDDLANCYALQRPEWDEIETPSHTGVLTEVFLHALCHRTRSLHPTHSVSGCGPSAATLLSRHHMDSTPVSGNSSRDGLMRDYATYILMVGVGLETCTAIHLAEETINPDLYLLPPHTVEHYRCRDRCGVVHDVLTRRHRRLDRDFPQFAASLAEKGQIHRGNIAECPYLLLSLSDLLREVFSLP